MRAYLKALGLHIYLATTKKFYLDNDKHIEVNAQAIDALMHTLSKEQFSLISHYDSAFTVWNTLTSPELQTINYVGKEPFVDDSNETCYMVQGIDSLEVHSDTHIDDSASSSNDDHDSMDAHALNEKLSLFCENLLNKYEL